MAIIICPCCQTPFENDKTEAMPFCSQRCRGIDLGHWLDEEHGLPWEPQDTPPDVVPPPENN